MTSIYKHEPECFSLVGGDDPDPERDLKGKSIRKRRKKQAKNAGSSQSMAHGSPRVGSGDFRKITGWVGSGQELFKISRVWAGHPDPTRPDPTRDI